MTSFDDKFMSYALNLAEKNIGNSSPNPSVATVIVQDNIIIASGVTAVGGRPHAEKVALDKANNLNNAALYVTLEPCFHEGRGPACCQEIIKSGIKKVIIATQDNDQRTNGKGIAALKNAGIEVIYGILENRAKKLYQPFFTAKNHEIPYVTLKVATSLDGKIATKNFDSKWISNEKSRKYTHFLRANHDAILVGGNTVRKDNPDLGCRIAGLEAFSPKKFIISNSGIFDHNLKIFQNPVIVITNQKDLPTNSEIVNCSTNGDSIDLKAALEKIYQMNINSILIEAGGNLATQFIQENLIDKLVLVRSNKIIGNDGIAAINELGVKNISEAIGNFSRAEIKEFGDDVIEIFLRN
jgi:diaminohydroxyphosphoribosylaminopyrimidine deaminase/5-amino-6-(5-phosphoribosylamino)uracil reductase